MVKFKRMIFKPVPGTPAFHSDFGSGVLSVDDNHMARFLHHTTFSARRRFAGMFLASVWIFGSVSGIWAYTYAGNSLLSLMRSCLYGTVSIVDLLTVTALPFLISAIAVFLSCPWILFPVAFAKGFTAMFAAMGILHTFGGAGWLIRLLLCFSEAASLPILYWFWICCLQQNGSLLKAQTLLAGALLFLAGSMDYCLIAPFLADLIIL